ncbi:MAG TPA: Na+/H+ antiporter NhaC family protein [Bacillales bacterium]|nr:Na+/H+ antiporter NhaC family protein [Bacillales bacterium]
MAGTWLCLIPFLVVIPISMLTKQVQPGLFVGLLVGSYLINPDWLGGLEQMIGYIADNIVVKNNIRIILFLYAFAGLIGMIKFTGGIKGFVHVVSKKVKTKKGAMLLTWLSTLGTFSEPDFRIVTVAPIMKAMKDRLNLSKRKIGYAIEFTANPVIAIIPVATAFVGYMVTVIGQALDAANIGGTPYLVYVRSIPFNFFSFVIILVGIYYSFFKKGDETDSERLEQAPSANTRARAASPMNPAYETETSEEFGPDIHNECTGMYEQPTEADRKEREELKKQGRKDTPPHADQQEDLASSHKAYQKETPIRPWNLILPITVFLSLTLFLSWWDGHRKTKGFFEAFIKSDMLGVMLTALLAAVLAALIFFIFQRFSVAQLTTHFIKGGNELLSVIVMLALIWALTAVSEDLGFSHYISGHVRGWIPDLFVAPSLFALGVVISYFIGSSWGTWGLLMPLGVTLAAESGTNILLAIGAVFASGTFGAFASPLSDNTVTTCTVLDMPVVAYARSKLKPALVAAGISVVLFGAFSFFLGS